LEEEGLEEAFVLGRLALVFPFKSAWGLGGVFNIRSSTSSSRLRAGFFGMKLSSDSTMQAKVLHRLPPALSLQVGRIAIAYANLEHQFSAVISMILQLHKAEARLVLQNPPIFDSLDIVQDLLALRGLLPPFDFVNYRAELKEINIWRNNVCHGVWLKHPRTKVIYLRLTRGKWKKQKAFDPDVRRVVFPESVPFSPKQGAQIVSRINQAIYKAHELGGIVEALLETSPDKFPQQAPLADPLARRKAPKPQGPRESSQKR
jgi:hypothetical protein